MELLQALLILCGYLGARVADSGNACAQGACPAVPDRPVVAWTAPQTVRADEVHLFSRAAGQLEHSLERSEVLVVGPARERLTIVLTTRSRDER